MRALDSLTAFNACTRTAFFLFTAGAGVGCLGCLTGAASTATGSSMGRATGSNAAKLSPNSTSKGGTSLLQRNALELSPQELDRMLDEFYSK